MSGRREYQTDIPLGVFATAERISNEQAIADEIQFVLQDTDPTINRTEENLDELNKAYAETIRKIGGYQLFIASRSENRTL